MEEKYKSLSIFEFNRRFPNDDACYEYLVKAKWANGFTCSKCGHKRYCQGNSPYSRQCTSCKHHESPTSGTLFHKLKFPILKAFHIVYYMSTSKKGVASTELSRKLELRQKTCWAFQQKVKKAMKSSGNYPMKGIVEVDETVVGGEEEGVVGRKNKNKKLVVIGIEKKGKGISRMYGKVIKQSSSKELGKFFESSISKEAIIKTDCWPGYEPLKARYKNLRQIMSGKKGRNFPDMHRAIMLFKSWLRGIHHHVDHLQSYIDEYTYRFNRGFMQQQIFDNLMTRMVQREPYTYEMMKADII